MLINVLPFDVLHNTSPYSKLFRSSPKYLEFQPFGCLVFPLIRPYNSHKFSYRSLLCVYLGKSPLYSAYRCLDTTTSRLYLAKLVRFHPNTFPCAATPSTLASPPLPQPWLQMHWTPSSPPRAAPSGTPSASSSLHAPTLSSTVSSPTDSGSPPRSSPSPHLLVDFTSNFPSQLSPPHSSLPADSAATLEPVTRTHSMVLRPSTMHRRQANVATSTAASVHSEPATFKQASQHLEWRQAMQQEFDALTATHTWDLVPHPSHTNIIQNKWIFRVKQNADGSLDRYKARLVAKGFTQQSGLDY
jgi:hypothetical protein